MERMQEIQEEQQMVDKQTDIKLLDQRKVCERRFEECNRISEGIDHLQGGGCALVAKLHTLERQAM